jgi:hypothetical protein
MSLFPQELNCAYPVIKETVPVSALGYSTNNKYPSFPPIMSDGRTVTASWQPEAVANEELKKRNGIQSNWEYRKFLTQNSDMVMQHNFRNASNDVGYYVRQEDLSKIQKGNLVDFQVNPPYMYQSPSDKTKPLGYVNTDLKEMYLSREELYSRKIAPTVA